LAQSPPPTAEEAVELPKFEVTGKFNAEGWLYGRAGNLEFLSHLQEKHTRALADDLLTFREFLEAFHPAYAPSKHAAITIVLCAPSEDFEIFSTAQGSATSGDRYLIINGDNDVETMERELRRQLIAQGRRHAVAPAIPLWLELATIETLVAIEVSSPTRLEIGFPPFNPRSEGGKIVIPRGSSMTPRPTSSLQFALRYGDLIPLAQLFSLTRDSKPGQRAMFAHGLQATAFMHLCLYSAKHSQFRKAFDDFAKRLLHEQFSTTLFESCFGKSPAEMDWILRDYIFSPAMKYETRRYKVSPGETVTLRDARPSEVIFLLNALRSVPQK
jgi:hypothetical protein